MVRGPSAVPWLPVLGWHATLTANGESVSPGGQGLGSGEDRRPETSPHPSLNPQSYFGEHKVSFLSQYCGIMQIKAEITGTVTLPLLGEGETPSLVISIVWGVLAWARPTGGKRTNKQMWGGVWL